MRAPSNALARMREANLASVQQEILQQKAETLGRIARRAEEALRALAEFDGLSLGDDALRREELVAEAGEAVWFLVVQREATGLRDAEEVMRELRVPREVRLRMGLRRR